MLYKGVKIDDEYQFNIPQYRTVFFKHDSMVFTKEELEKVLAVIRETESQLEKDNIEHTPVTMDVDDEGDDDYTVLIQWMRKENEEQHNIRIENRKNAIDNTVNFRLKEAVKLVKELGGEVVFPENEN